MNLGGDSNTEVVASLYLYARRGEFAASSSPTCKWYERSFGSLTLTSSHDGDSEYRLNRPGFRARLD
jgi:hypothetical protein